MCMRSIIFDDMSRDIPLNILGMMIYFFNEIAGLQAYLAGTFFSPQDHFSMLQGQENLL
jgi:hypothetical protein